MCDLDLVLTLRIHQGVDEAVRCCWTRSSASSLQWWSYGERHGSIPRVSNCQETHGRFGFATDFEALHGADLAVLRSDTDRDFGMGCTQCYAVAVWTQASLHSMATDHLHTEYCPHAAFNKGKGMLMEGEWRVRVAIGMPTKSISGEL